MALIDTKTAEDYYAFLQRLYGRTYGSTDESSVFQRQLRSWAVLLSLGRSEIDRAFRNAYPDMANELVMEWERAYNLPNDTARSLAQRQARLAAHEREQRGAARDELQSTLDATGVLGSFVANRRDEILIQGSEDNAIFQTTLQLANEDYYDPILREAIETIYGNTIPGKQTGALDALGRGHSTCVEVDAEWNSSDHYVGRDAIARQVTTLRTEFQPAARVRSFGPGSRIDARDLNRIQETTAGCPLTGGLNLTDYSSVNAGLDQYWFGAECPNGVPTQIDSSIDWRDRMVFCVCQFSYANAGSAVDFVPSGASDDQWGDNSNGGAGNQDVSQNASGFAFLYTGTGRTGASVFTSYIVGTFSVTRSLELYSDTSGDLYLSAVDDDFFVSGVLFVTPQLGK